MEAGRPADVSVRDLVEEFQTLDVDEMGDANTNAGFSDTTLEQSIGGDDISGIPAVDGDDEEEDDRETDDEAAADILDQVKLGAVASAIKGASLMATPSPPKSLLCPSCFTEHDRLSKFCKFCGELVCQEPTEKSQDRAGDASVSSAPVTEPGARQGMIADGDGDGVSDERESESEAWDSVDSEPSTGAIAPVADFHPVEGRSHGVGSSRKSGSGDSSNPNMSSPTRPDEASSDWDCVEGESSDTISHNENGQRFARENIHSRDTASTDGMRSPEPHCAASLSAPRVDSTAMEKKPAVTSAGEAAASNVRDLRPQANSRPAECLPDGRQEVQRSDTDKHSTLSPILGSRRPVERLSSAIAMRGERRGLEPIEAVIIEGVVCSKEQDNGSSVHVVTEQGSSGAAAVEEAVEESAAKEAAETAAATIKTLQSELSLLKELVLSSEQKREEELSELRIRLEAQERRNRLPASDGDPQQMLSENGQRKMGAGALNPSCRAQDDNADSGGVSPRSTGVHNPFAAQEGGVATTPRDHFPAFEDALHDGASDDCAPSGNREGNNGDDEGGGDKSMQSEGFDFSIDTLSHINNHTDFGTEAPVTATVAEASSMAANAASGSGSKRTIRHPRGPESSARGLATSPLAGEQGCDEVFDAQGTAAEEAFFADACATASLKTPVKHVLATGGGGVAGGGAVPGVAVRRARQQDRRGARGTPAERPGAPADGATSRTAQRAATATSARNGKRNTASRESQGLEGEDLCMADLFARATRQLEDSAEEGGGRGLPVAASGGAAAGRNAALYASPRSEKARPVGVNIGTQTTWSFSGHEGVRFVSTPLRTPLHTLVEAGRGISPPTEHLVGWGLRCPPARRSELPLIGGDFEREAEMDTHSLRDNESFCTPQRFQQLRRRAPEDSSGVTVETNEASRGEISGIASERSNFFNSPGLSPIVDARPRLGREKVQVHNFRDSPGHCGSDTRYGSSKQTRSGGRGRMRQEMSQGLSPILSERSEHAPSGGEEARASSGVGSAASRVENIGVVKETAACAATGQEVMRATAGRGERPLRTDDDWDCSSGSRKGKQDSDGSESGQQWTPAAARRQACSSAFAESSPDVSGLSIIPASTTLETMALLEDTTRSFSSFCAGSSFPGDLFADARLRDSSIFHSLRRQEVASSSQAPNLKGGKWLIAPSPPQDRSGQRRPRSAPTLLPEREVGTSTRQERRMRDTSQGPGPAVDAVPPAVVGAWLAAALEGFYSHNAEAGGGACRNTQRAQKIGNGSNQSEQEAVPRFLGPVDLDPALERSPLTDVRRRRENQAALLREARTMGIRDEDVQFEYARAIATPARAYPVGRGDSPPPPPPPPDGVVDGDISKMSNEEEEIFYQRQRLIHRAVTAAARHGGIMQLPARGNSSCMGTARAAKFNFGEETEEERENYVNGGWRRHSDPPSWVTPPPPTGVAEGGVAGARRTGAIVDARTTMGTSPYLRRHTSEYWRERLGMTQ